VNGLGNWEGASGSSIQRGFTRNSARREDL
jgi:hypothetical protein